MQIDCDFGVVQALCRQAFRKYVTEDNPDYYNANDHLPPVYQIVNLDVEWQAPTEGVLKEFGKFVIRSAEYESTDLMYNYSSENVDEFGRLLSFCKSKAEDEDENAREEESFNMNDLHLERSENTEEDT